MEIKTKKRDYLNTHIDQNSLIQHWDIVLRKDKIISLLSLWTREFFIECISWFQRHN